MISDGVKKIAARSLSQDTYLDEMPLNWWEYGVNNSDRRMNKKSFRIMNREHKINSYPEE
jgi:hypothetical protein